MTTHLESSGHPEHTVLQEPAPGVWEPAIPVEIRSWTGFKVRRECRRKGGHWWHPVSVMLRWGCCNCGARTDGMPFDGS